MSPEDGDELGWSERLTAFEVETTEADEEQQEHQ